jgi:hypothetical protein
VSTGNASASTAASLQVDTLVATANAAAANTASIASEEDDRSIQSTATDDVDSIQSLLKTVQYLAHSTNARVDAALDALELARRGQKKKTRSKPLELFCLVQLLKKYLDKAIARISGV